MAIHTVLTLTLTLNDNPNCTKLVTAVCIDTLFTLSCSLYGVSWSTVQAAGGLTLTIHYIGSVAFLSGLLVVVCLLCGIHYLA